MSLKLKYKIDLPDNAPVADKKPQQHTDHGITRSDNYHWMRADNWQEAMREPDKLPEPVKSYLQAENNYCAEAMLPLAQLQKDLIAEMRGRMREQDESLPESDGTYAYCDRHIEGAEHPVYFRTDRDGGNEQLLIDINHEAEGHEYFSHDLVEHSPDHKTLAWCCDTSGAEYYRLFFRNIDTSKDSAIVIEDVGSVAWADGQTIYYTRVDENHRPSKVFKHTLGSDPADDALVYHEKDNRFFCDVYTSRSGKFIFIASGMDDQDEVWFIPINAAGDASQSIEPQLIEPRSDGLEYSVDHQGNDTDNRFVVLSNTDDAQDFKLSVTDCDKPGRQHWTDFQVYQPGRMIHTFEVFRDWVMWLAV